MTSKPTNSILKSAIFAIALIIGIIFLLRYSEAQTMGFGGQPATKFAATLAECPVASSGYFACIVVPADGTQPFLALSVAGFNNGSAFAVLSQGPKGDTGAAGAAGATGATGPPGPVQGFDSLACGTGNLNNSGLTASSCKQSTP